MNNDRQEKNAIEELAAALAQGVAGSIQESGKEVVEMALEELGALDGMEFDLPGVLKDPVVGGVFVAEELVMRPEVQAALSAVATELIRRLKNGI